MVFKRSKQGYNEAIMAHLNHFSDKLDEAVRRVFDQLYELRHPVAYDRVHNAYVVAPGLRRMQGAGLAVEEYNPERHDGNLVCRGCECAELELRDGYSQAGSAIRVNPHFVTRKDSKHDDNCAYHPDHYTHVKIHAPIEIDESRGYRLNLNGIRPPQSKSGTRLSGRDERGVWTNFDDDLKGRELASFSSLTEFFTFVSRIVSKSPRRLWDSVVVHGQTKTGMKNFLTNDLQTIAGNLFNNIQHPIAFAFNLKSGKNMMLSSGDERSVFLPAIQVYHPSMRKMVSVVPRIIFDDPDVFMSMRGKGGHYVLGVPFMRPVCHHPDRWRELSFQDEILSGVDYTMNLRVTGYHQILQTQGRDILGAAVAKVQTRMFG